MTPALSLGATTLPAVSLALYHIKHMRMQGWQHFSIATPGFLEAKSVQVSPRSHRSAARLLVHINDVDSEAVATWPCDCQFRELGVREWLPLRGLFLFKWMNRVGHMASEEVFLRWC
jgi:hypothetical protein